MTPRPSDSPLHQAFTNAVLRRLHIGLSLSLFLMSVGFPLQPMAEPPPDTTHVQTGNGAG